MSRTARVGQARLQKLIAELGFNMPPTNADGSGTPPSTAIVLGQVAGAPRRVHHLAGIVLASLIGRGATPLQAPTLIKRYDFTDVDNPRRRPDAARSPPTRSSAPAAAASSAPCCRRRSATRPAASPPAR